MTTANTKRKAPIDISDLFNTPLDALEAAYEAGMFDEFDVYYDPCNGLGKISDFLESKGKTVYASDIEDYYVQVDYMGDFLELESIPEDIECIVFNPPFKLTQEFIDKALELCDNLIMFNRATVLETKDRSVKHKNKEWRLEKFWSFANRVSCTEGEEEKKTANAVWYGWFKYNNNYIGFPTLDWLFTK